MPDEDIEVILESQTGLEPSTIKRYLRQEESNADKFARFADKYGLPQRKRLTISNNVKPLPLKDDGRE